MRPVIYLPRALLARGGLYRDLHDRQFVPDEAAAGPVP